MKLANICLRHFSWPLHLNFAKVKFQRSENYEEYQEITINDQRLTIND